MAGSTRKGNALYDQNGQLPVVTATSGGNAVNLTQLSAAISTATTGFVPDTRTVNGHALSSDVVVTAADVGSPRALFVHVTNQGNITTGETDLYSDTIAANQLATNLDSIEASYTGSWTNGTSTKQIQVYFAGNVIFNTGPLSISTGAAWIVSVQIIRVDSSNYRASISLLDKGAPLSVYTDVSASGGVDWTVTNILKITGQAAGVGAATNDIVAQLGTVQYFPHP